MNKEKKEMMEEITFPPQSSIKLEPHGKDNGRYYTWEVKVYCDDLDKCFSEICRMDKLLRDKYYDVDNWETA